MATIEYRVRHRVAFELEKFMSSKDPDRESWPWANADKVTEAINGTSNVELLRLISGAIEARLTN